MKRGCNRGSVVYVIACEDPAPAYESLNGLAIYGATGWGGLRHAYEYRTAIAAQQTLAAYRDVRIDARWRSAFVAKLTKTTLLEEVT